MFLKKCSLLLMALVYLNACLAFRPIHVSVTRSNIQSNRKVLSLLMTHDDEVAKHETTDGNEKITKTVV